MGIQQMSISFHHLLTDTCANACVCTTQGRIGESQVKEIVTVHMADVQHRLSASCKPNRRLLCVLADEFIRSATRSTQPISIKAEQERYKGRLLVCEVTYALTEVSRAIISQDWQFVKFRGAVVKEY